MLETGSLGTLRKDELYDSLFQSVDKQFGGTGENLEEQAELFLKEINPMALVVAFNHGGRAEGVLKELPSELRTYILGILEEATQTLANESILVSPISSKETEAD
jgi:hypothetical protein